MSGEEEETQSSLDAIVVGFDDEDRVLASLTSPVSPEELQALKDRIVIYEDFKGVIWEGKIIDIQGDVLLVEFAKSAFSEGGPSGLGQGSLLRILG